MTDPRPFSFDQDFGDEGRGAPVTERRKRVYLADEVELIRAFALNEGETSVASRAKEAELAALQQIAEAARTGLTILAQVAHEHRAGAAELALVAARKIAGGALARFPTAPIEAALESLGREIESQPRLVIRMNEPSDAMRAAVEGAARDAGFAGQIVFKPDAGPVSAAFAIEWGDGRAAFDPEAAAARIAETFEAALAAEGLHGEALGVPAGAPDHLSPPGA